MVHGVGKFVGEVDTTNSDGYGDKYRGKHSRKKITHTQRITVFIIYREINPVPWTQAYTINHNTPSSWNYSNQPHCSTCKLLSISRAPILIPSTNLETVCPLH